MESQSIKDRAPLNRSRATQRTVPACQWTITASETDVELRTSTGVPVLATGTSTGTVLPYDTPGGFWMPPEARRVPPGVRATACVV